MEIYLIYNKLSPAVLLTSTPWGLPRGFKIEGKSVCPLMLQPEQITILDRLDFKGIQAITIGVSDTDLLSVSIHTDLLVLRVATREVYAVLLEVLALTVIELPPHMRGVYGTVEQQINHTKQMIGRILSMDDTVAVAS